MDETVVEKYGAEWSKYFAEADIDATVVEIPGGEAAKSEETCERILRAMMDFDITRDEPMVVVGGGVAHDVAGHAANRFHRGVLDWVFIATTAVAILDAAFGWKVGENRFGQKNLDGGFKPAKRVFLVLRFLATLDARRISDALAEALKVALMVDPILFDLIHEYGARLVKHRFQPADDLPIEVIWEIIMRAVAPMLDEQAENPDVSEPERWPEFGHDAGKRWEMRDVGRLFHGETVAMNCALLAQIAHARTNPETGRPFLSRANRDRAIETWRRVGLPIYDAVMEDRHDLAEGLAGATRMRRGQAIPAPVDLGRKPCGLGERDMGCRFFYDLTVGEAMAAVAALRELAGAR
jgi:3-dehydroquinate synthase